MIRLIITLIVTGIDTFIMAMIAMIGGIFNPFSRFNTAVTRTWARIILLFAGTKLIIEGSENIEKDRSYIVVSNHQSKFDIPVLIVGIKTNLRIIAKKELFKIPFLGWGMKAVGMLEIDRSNHKQSIETLKKAEKVVKEHHLSILVFPEGTRSRDGKLLPFKKGSFVLAINTGLPILPVSLSGTRKISPDGERKLRKGRVKIKIHPPISVESMELTDRTTLLEKTQRIVESDFIENYH
jgi:1-acyl-sn-glycerol-3-phosphate acyltransferase